MKMLIEKWKILNRFQKIAIVLAGLVVLYTVVGFLIAPALLKMILEKKLSEQLKRATTIEKVSMNPYALTLEINGFEMKEPEGAETFVSFKDLQINLQTLSLIKLAPVIEEFRIVDPYVRIVRKEGNRFNFSDLLKSEEAQKEPEKSEAESEAGPPRFLVSNIQVENGSIEVVDLQEDEKHLISELQLGIPVVSNLDVKTDPWVEPHLSAKVNGSPLSLDGRVKFLQSPSDSVVSINIEKIDLPYYATYLPEQLDLKLVSGTLDLKTEIDFLAGGEEHTSVKVAGEVSVNGLELTSGDDSPLIKLDRVVATIADFDPLAGKLRIAEVNVVSPEMNVERDSSGKTNFEKVYQQPAEGSGKPADESAAETAEGNGFSLVLDQFNLTDGKVRFADASAQGSFQTELSEIDVRLVDFSIAPGSKASFEISAKTEKGEELSGKGDLSVDPLSSNGHIEVRGIDIPKYLPYFGEQVPVGIQSASLDFATDYEFSMEGEEPDVKLSNIVSAIRSMSLVTKGESSPGEFLKVGEISLTGGRLDLAQKHLSIDRISSQNGLIKLTRLEDGSLDLQKSFAKPEAAEAAPAETSAPASGGDWDVKIQKIEFSDYAIEAKDLSAPDPVSISLDQIRLDLANLSTDMSNESDVALSFRLNKTGKASVAGKLRPEPLFAELNLKLEGIDIAQLEPYYREYVKVIVTEGSLSADGKVSLAKADDAEMKVSYAGDIAFTNFDSVRKAEEKEMVKWQKFAINGIEASNIPAQFHVSRIELVGFTSYVRINKDGTINVRQVLKGEAETPKGAESEQKKAGSASEGAAAAAAPKEVQPAQSSKPADSGDGKPSIKIDEIVLSDDVIDFTDSFIEPGFHASFYDAEGTITGLSSERGTSAEVDIKAKLSEYAPAEIAGRLNLFGDDMFVDMVISAKNIDLTVANPYAHKFAGYHIEKGKLDFKFNYKIENGNLDALHHVRFDELTIGAKVDSPDAPDLPIKLAISLLQDRNNQIILDVPVTGDIQNPQFDFSQVIKTAFSNILRNIVTAPFALIASAFGGGEDEDLSSVEFGPGSSEISEQAEEKLTVIAKALFERPKLELEVTGYADPVRDKEALAEQKLQERLKLIKTHGTVLSEEEIEEVTLSDEEIPQLLQQAFIEEFYKGAKKNVQIKGLTPEQMKKSLLAKMEISEEDLRNLGKERAKSVRDFIVKAKGIDPERIFIMSPESLVPEGKDQWSASVAILSLK